MEEYELKYIWIFAMGKIMVQRIFLGFLLQLIGLCAADLNRLNIWPMPVSVQYGHQSLYLSKDFVLKTEGTKYADALGILKDGFSRLLDVVEAAHVIELNYSHFDPSLLLQGIHVVILSPNDEGFECLVFICIMLKLQHGVDESYKLLVPMDRKPVYAHLEAQTVYGALHGLQTFSQFCQFNFTSRVIEVRQVPWTIIDQPRFSYRGLLIDTSRHYQPLPMIKRVIDSMVYAKLNVLHWHIVDSQSFPLEIPSYPKIWDGAYSIAERYTMADAAEIVRQLCSEKRN
ncbi:hypothetical protein RJ640_017439 [Escallonia rubra]|uniref:beta-N-acetylhexosaminidase n=1 Tax=Escallonia rubra TaxID=112253 RepID=A0AA88R3M3_9ASTE|nr:hypothetical protein RJ640_017439 [Escallonia rubra]